MQEEHSQERPISVRRTCINNTPKGESSKDGLVATLPAETAAKLSATNVPVVSLRYSSGTAGAAAGSDSDDELPVPQLEAGVHVLLPQVAPSLGRRTARLEADIKALRDLKWELVVTSSFFSTRASSWREDSLWTVFSFIFSTTKSCRHESSRPQQQGRKITLMTYFKRKQ